MKKILLTLTALGIAASTLTTAGIFAGSTDTAQLSGLDVKTGEQGSVDLQVAPYVDGECGAWSEDLSLTVDSHLEYPGGGPVLWKTLAAVCIRNNGTATGRVNVVNEVVSSTEVDCTGDEATVDPTCTIGADGELDELSNWQLHNVTDDIYGLTIREWGTGTTAGELGTLDPDQVKVVDFAAGFFSTTTDPLIPAQSDKLITKFTFSASLA